MALSNFSYMVPGQLAGMAYPSDGARDLAELLRLGFRSVVALGRPAPTPVPAGLEAFHHPLEDFTRLPVEDIDRAVAAVRNAPRPTAVFCGGGVGRTGVVLACYLASLGRTAYQAISEVRAARPGSIDDPALELSVHDYFEFFAMRSRARGSKDRS